MNVPVVITAALHLNTIPKNVFTPCTSPLLSRSMSIAMPSLIAKLGVLSRRFLIILEYSILSVCALRAHTAGPCITNALNYRENKVSHGFCHSHRAMVISLQTAHSCVWAQLLKYLLRHSCAIPSDHESGVNYKMSSMKCKTILTWMRPCAERGTTVATHIMRCVMDTWWV